jgi:hypothetical protein
MKTALVALALSASLCYAGEPKISVDDCWQKKTPAIQRLVPVRHSPRWFWAVLKPWWLFR